MWQSIGNSGPAIVVAVSTAAVMWGGKMLLNAIRDGGANKLVGRVDANERKCKANCDAVTALSTRVATCETAVALLRQENTIRRERCTEHESTMREIKHEIDGIGRRRPRDDDD